MKKKIYKNIYISNIFLFEKLRIYYLIYYFYINKNKFIFYISFFHYYRTDV